MDTLSAAHKLFRRARRLPALTLLAWLPIAALFAGAMPAHAQVQVSIGVNFPVYPNLVLVPGYPVYYDPQADANYFFYDGEYWIYTDDNWYSSPWYNGPWDLVAPEFVPLFVLRVPVRYYRVPPPYFRGWAVNAPPRWGVHWGHAWEEHHAGWNHWNHQAVPHAAPLPVYQKQYSGDRYPHAIAQQHAIRVSNYKYQPHTAIARQHFQNREQPNASTPHQTTQRENVHPENAHPHQENTHPATTRSAPPHGEQQRAAPQHAEQHPPQTLAPPAHAAPQVQSHAQPSPPRHEEHHEQQRPATPPHPQAARREPAHEQPQAHPRPAPQGKPREPNNEQRDSHDEHRRQE